MVNILSRRALKKLSGDLGLSRAELLHVVYCGDCSLTGDIEPGPSYCRAFRHEFRGHELAEMTDEQRQQAAAVHRLWGAEVERQLSIWKEPGTGWGG